MPEQEPPHDEEHVASLKGMGHAITILRERRALSREEVAPKAEMSVEALEALERGEVHESWGGLRKVAYAIGIPLPGLLTEAEELAPGPGGEKWRLRSGEADSGSTDAARSDAAEMGKRS